MAAAGRRGALPAARGVRDLIALRADRASPRSCGRRLAVDVNRPASSCSRARRRQALASGGDRRYAQRIFRGGRLVIGPGSAIPCSNCWSASWSRTKRSPRTPCGWHIRSAARAADPDATVVDSINDGSDRRQRSAPSCRCIWKISLSERACAVAGEVARRRAQPAAGLPSLKPANVLVLDDPTNDLGIETLELLEGSSALPGTVLLVSHDRVFPIAW